MSNLLLNMGAMTMEMIEAEIKKEEHLKPDNCKYRVERNLNGAVIYTCGCTNPLPEYDFMKEPLF